MSFSWTKIIGNPSSSTSKLADFEANEVVLHHGASQQLVLNPSSAVDRTQFMPVEWVKAAIVIRCMTLMEGKSGVRMQVITSMLELLKHQVIPLVPLQGSVSASGDLMPLSYVAATMQGRPDILVSLGRENHKVCNAQEGLAKYNIAPMQFQAKEALGMVNGTAFSTSVGVFAFCEAKSLAHLGLTMTGMATEALRGNIMNYEPLLFSIHDQDGMHLAARLIRASVENSSLVRTETSIHQLGLHQDRYSLRTVPQWLGPALQDLAWAEIQLDNELKSVSDNPLVFSPEEEGMPGRIVYGGNFQATRITSAMEKVRLAILLVGRMIFAQCSEVINPAMSNGLPPNLAPDDPSLSFTAKGIDINMAAYMSELCHKCNGSVLAGMQSAEMHNQNLNSLALVAARNVHDAKAVLEKMCACYLWVLCQALDLRVLNENFLDTMRITTPAEVLRCLSLSTARACNGVNTEKARADVEELEQLLKQVLNAMRDRWLVNANLDMEPRCKDTVNASMGVIIAFFVKNGDTYTTTRTNSDTEFGPDASSPPPIPPVHERINRFCRTLAEFLAQDYDRLRQEMFKNHTSITPKSLGEGSRTLYMFVRHDLGIPMHRGFVEAWNPSDTEGDAQGSAPQGKVSNIGVQIGQILAAIRNGACAEVVKGFLGPLMSGEDENEGEGEVE